MLLFGAAAIASGRALARNWRPIWQILPYALLLGRSALWLWMVTAVAAGFAAPVFGARTAYRRMGLHPTGRTMPVWNDPTKEIELMERALDHPTTASGAV